MLPFLKNGDTMFNTITHVDPLNSCNKIEKLNNSQSTSNCGIAFRLQGYVRALLTQGTYFYEKINHNLNFFILRDPLAFNKAAERMPWLSIEERQEIIKLALNELRKVKIFQLWEKFKPLAEKDKINHLAKMLEIGTCVGQAVCLLELMKKHARSSSMDLHKKLKEHQDDVIFIQLMEMVYLDLVLFKHSNEQEIEELKDFYLSLPSPFIYDIFAFTPLANSISIQENGFNQATKLIRYWCKKVINHSDNQKVYCVPILLKNKLDGNIPSHVIFIQITPICRLYDPALPHMGFYEFANIEEMLKNFPAYLNKYYKEFEEIQLPLVYPEQTTKRTGVLLEIL